MSDENPDTRLRRLKMRSSRRGIKEMDIVLGNFAQSGLGAFSEEEFALYEDLLGENDQDLLSWVTGQSEAPERHKEMLARIARHLSAS